MNVLVIGGAGKSGRRVVEKLKSNSIHVYSTVRDLKNVTTSELLFSWDDTCNWSDVLRGQDAIFIVHPDTSIPEAQDQIKALVEYAKNAAVKKLVLLSSRGQESVLACENVIKNSALRWTIVRSAWFNQNFTEGHFSYGIQTGEVVFMADTVKEPFVDLDDLSEVVVACLLQEKHDGQIYEVTGDELFTFKEAVSMIAEQMDKSVEYRAVSGDVYFDLLVQHGLPAEAAKHLVFAFSEILDGRNRTIGNGVQRVLERTPKKFQSFVQKNFTLT
jgi:uncharacterized protein YbjT (DUF2867 family)